VKRVDPTDGARRLQVIYDDLSGAFANASCPRSTRCCRFKQTGLTPYVWPVEGERVLAAVARNGNRLPRGGEPGDCPLLKRDGSCSIYADRPFGCRTYFCSDATLPDGHPRAAVDAAAKALRTLSDERRERDLVPLSTYLDKAFGADGRRRR